MKRSLHLLAALPLLVAGASSAAIAQSAKETPGGYNPTGPNSAYHVTVLGNSEAAQCSDHAKLVADGKMSPAFAVETCTEALQVEALSDHDLAATHVNRGVVRMGMADMMDDARADFDEAAKIQPGLGESYVNRGILLTEEKQYAAGLEDLNKAVELPLTEPWKAYYNRGVTEEALGDIQGAYRDYMKASELKPDWAAPKTELARFQVKKPG